MTNVNFAVFSGTWLASLRTGLWEERRPGRAGFVTWLARAQKIMGQPKRTISIERFAPSDLYRRRWSAHDLAPPLTQHTKLEKRGDKEHTCASGLLRVRAIHISTLANFAPVGWVPWFPGRHVLLYGNDDGLETSALLSVPPEFPAHALAARSAR